MDTDFTGYTLASTRKLLYNKKLMSSVYWCSKKQKDNYLQGCCNSDIIYYREIFMSVLYMFDSIQVI